MTNGETNIFINGLFTKLEIETKAANHCLKQSLHGAPEMQDSYSRVYEETDAEVFKITKRLIRAFFRAGEIGELLSHIDAGTFPRYSIQAAMGRLETLRNN